MDSPPLPLQASLSPLLDGTPPITLPVYQYSLLVVGRVGILANCTTRCSLDRFFSCHLPSFGFLHLHAMRATPICYASQIQAARQLSS